MDIADDKVGVDDGDTEDSESLLNESYVLHLMRTLLDPVTVLKEQSSSSSSSTNMNGTTLCVEAATTLWDMSASSSVAAFMYRHSILDIIERVLSTSPALTLTATPTTTSAVPAPTAAVVASHDRLLECTIGMLANLITVFPTIARDMLTPPSAAQSKSSSQSTNVILPELLIGLLCQSQSVSVITEIVRAIHAAITVATSAPSSSSSSPGLTSSHISHIRMVWYSTLFIHSHNSNAGYQRLLSLFRNSFDDTLTERLSTLLEALYINAPINDFRTLCLKVVLNGGGGAGTGLFDCCYELIADVVTHKRFPVSKPLFAATTTATVATMFAKSKEDSKSTSSLPTTAHYSDPRVRTLSAALRMMEVFTRSLKGLSTIIPHNLVVLLSSSEWCHAVCCHVSDIDHPPSLISIPTVVLLPNIIHLLLPNLLASRSMIADHLLRRLWTGSEDTGVEAGLCVFLIHHFTASLISPQVPASHFSNEDYALIRSLLNCRTELCSVIRSVFVDSATAPTTNASNEKTELPVDYGLSERLVTFLKSQRTVIVSGATDAAVLQSSIEQMISSLQTASQRPQPPSTSSSLLSAASVSSNGGHNRVQKRK